ncbi:hypothetical protein J2S74_002844 [Evansella vedderi]|uniref:Uncharacterized protein n=1 Tax=Evansella vedderi TaxID=38282 RepID=A0ABT9ZXJ9_9BACI|nr:hypothetical protein [Evansella vedderi]MDQ0255462.1 hypothetical protein [Evansella vedderi]
MAKPNTTIHKSSKIYRKLLNAKSEYQVFKIIERLDEKTSKQVLNIFVEQQRNKSELLRESV